MRQIFLTKEGLDKLKKELQELKNKRPIMVRHLDEARAQGDLKENAEYHATKEALTKLTKRIVALEEKVSSARIIDDANRPKDKVLLGSVVHVKNVQTGEAFKYQLVDTEEVNIDEGKISIISPVGEGLFEHKVGDLVEIKVPAGALKLKILKIE